MNADQGKQELSQNRTRCKRKTRRICVCLAVLVSCVVFPLLTDRYVGSFGAGRLYDDVDSVPHRRAAMVLGCGKYARGRLNLFYAYRISAAVNLWHAGKIDAILISGDNSRKDYDEPETMKADLVAGGVPAEFITLDYAGFSTLDSVIRANEIFGLCDYIVVSQRFHCQRAIYLAQKHGQSAIGYCAVDPTGPLSTKVRLRETLARVKAVLDVMFSQEPTFLGPAEEVKFRQS